MYRVRPVRFANVEYIFKINFFRVIDVVYTLYKPNQTQYKILYDTPFL